MLRLEGCLILCHLALPAHPTPLLPAYICIWEMYSLLSCHLSVSFSEILARHLKQLHPPKHATCMCVCPCLRLLSVKGFCFGISFFSHFSSQLHRLPSLPRVVVAPFDGMFLIAILRKRGEEREVCEAGDKKGRAWSEEGKTKNTMR